MAAIGSGNYDLIVLNFANPDMVGHTGSLPAAIRAVEAVDAGLGRIVAAIEAAGGALLVTADHGNCELMRDPDDRRAAHRAHHQPGAGAAVPRRRDRRCTTAGWPTSRRRCSALMGLPQPAEMTGRSLIGP